MKEFFAAYPALAWSLVSVMLALVVVATLWDKVKWWWLNTWMTFPVIGRIARLSRDTNTGVAGWLKSETTLCDAYRHFITVQDEHDYNERVRYLKYAGDTGRRPVPPWIWLLTVAMVFVEAMGFSYVLAGYTLPGASENLQQTGAYGIAFLISIILVALTHFAGHELYVTGKVAGARREWNDKGSPGDLWDGTVPLAEPQSTDDGRPVYARLLNRVGTITPSYKITVLTAVFVFFVAVFATYVRGQVLEKSLHQEVVGAVVQSKGGSFDGLDMSTDAQLPVADLAQDQDTLNKVKEDEVSIDRHGGWATFIVLAFVFVFLQILGVLFGYRWGFAGLDSASAFRGAGSGRFSSYADVRKEYEQIAAVAQAKLGDLQQRLQQRNSASGTRGIGTTRTFYDYVALQRQQAGDRANANEHAERDAAARRGTAQQISSPVATSPAVITPDAAPATSSDLDNTVRLIDAMSSKEEKLRHIQSLPEARQQQVIAALKRAKESRERMAAELDDLL